jgi:hypothetical protein
VAANPQSHTGTFLRPLLAGGLRSPLPEQPRKAAAARSRGTRPRTSAAKVARLKS